MATKRKASECEDKKINVEAELLEFLEKKDLTIRSSSSLTAQLMHVLHTSTTVQDILKQHSVPLTVEGEILVSHPSCKRALESASQDLQLPPGMIRVEGGAIFVKGMSFAI